LAVLAGINLSRAAAGTAESAAVRMEQLIPVVNKLQEVFEAIEPDGDEGMPSVDLPRIVVVGSQSSGKSSVLESLVQRDFLPRGKDIVTRRPLILQLLHKSGEEWGEFGHLPGRKFGDFLQIRREIEEETARVAGINKGISRSPIHLRIYSPRVVNLTLVDLPGITKIPIGEQPPDIEQQVRTLVLEYISRPNSIILAVTPANSDLVNSDALKIAREVDPSGLRTIGVLTKLDLMDAGTHAADILVNRASFRLKLGFVGVVNRSQHDINVNKPINEAARQETEFFKNHLHYRSISHRCGTQFLARELNKILLQHIRDQLPELRTRINSLILATQNELTSLGDLGFPGKTHRGTLLLRLVTNYVTDFHEAIEGTLRRNATSDELTGGARINCIFNEVYANAVNQFDASSGLTLSEVRNAIRNASGPRPALFVPEASFEVLVRKQIAKLETPAQKCADLVFEELQKLVHRLDRKEYRRFPNLSAKMVEAASELLRERLEPTLAMIENLVRIEMAYINTNHPDFCRAGAGLGALAKIVEDRRHRLAYSKSASEEPVSNNITLPPTTQSRQGNKEESGFLSYLFRGQPIPTQRPGQSPTNSVSLTPQKNGTSPGKNRIITPFTPEPSPTENFEMLSEKEEVETQLIMTLLHSYFGIVRKNILDSVPKAVMHFLVNHVVEQLGTRLVTELYKEELFVELLQEDETVVRQRARCKTALEAYRQAALILSELRDSDVTLKSSETQ
jgi:dynamin 1-like protein